VTTSARLPVCRTQSHMWRNTKSIKVKIWVNVGTTEVDYRMQYYDVTINP